jgi:hypothetical protein
VTAWEPTTGDCWGGRPIAHRIADAAPRRRVVVTGTIFGGPRPVPGMVKGVVCTVEATAVSNGAVLVLWNPFYRFEP